MSADEYDGEKDIRGPGPGVRGPGREKATAKNTKGTKKKREIKH